MPLLDGRAGASGTAISLVSPDETPYMRDIVRLLGKDIPALPTPAFEIKESAGAPRDSDDRPPRPAQSGGGGHSHRGRGAPQGSGAGQASQGQRAPRQGGQQRPGSSGGGGQAARSFKPKRSWGR